MKKLLIISVFFTSCAAMKQDRVDYNASAQMKLISWQFLPERRVKLSALTKCGDTAYLYYFYPGARPRFERGMKITVMFDSAEWKPKIPIRSKILLNQ